MVGRFEDTQCIFLINCRVYFQQVYMPSGRGLGGCSLINGVIHLRGNKKDYDDWAIMGARGWSYEEVFPYFKKMEDNQDPEMVKNGKFLFSFLLETSLRLK